MTPLLWVIGSINQDQVINLPHLPKPGETLAGELTYHYGGKGANQAVAAARAGLQVAMIGAVGNDPAGADMVANLAAAGIDVSTVMTINGVPSGVAQIWVDKKGENSIALAPGANARISHWPQPARWPSHALLQSELPTAFLEYAFAELARQHVAVIWNNAPATRLPEASCRQVNTLIVNQLEAAMMLEQEPRPAEQMAMLLAQRFGFETVIITLGAKGALLLHGGAVLRQPAFAVNPVDTTGAGDVFSGYWVTARVQGKSLEESLQWACAAAALSTQVAGAQPSIPSAVQVEAFMAQAAVSA